jgi:hypothetical protein
MHVRTLSIPLHPTVCLQIIIIIIIIWGEYEYDGKREKIVYKLNRQ